MANETEFLFHALFMGAYITFVYDIFRILRRVFPHGAILVSLEDICFWIYCAVKVFLLMYREGGGTLRWFAVLGALVGMLLYRKLASPYFVKYTALILRKIGEICAKILRVLLAPLRVFVKKTRERADRAAKRYAVKRQKRRRRIRAGLKKKLTYVSKMVKINL